MFDDPAPIYAGIGSALAAARRSKRLSQLDLAEALAISRASVSNIEAGRQKILVHTLLQAAAFLEVPVTTLLPSATDSALDLPLDGPNLKSHRRLDRNERLEIFAFLERVKAPDAD